MTRPETRVAHLVVQLAETQGQNASVQARVRKLERHRGGHSRNSYPLPSSEGPRHCGS